MYFKLTPHNLDSHTSSLKRHGWPVSTFGKVWFYVLTELLVTQMQRFIKTYQTVPLRSTHLLFMLYLNQIP